MVIVIAGVALKNNAQQHKLISVLSSFFNYR